MTKATSLLHRIFGELQRRRVLRTAALYIVGASLETGNVWQNSDDIALDNMIVAGSLYLALDTPIGPIYVAYGLTDTDESSFYVHIGPRVTF